jgi:hypothetical protein
MQSGRSRLAFAAAVVAFVASGVAAGAAESAPPGKGLGTTPFTFECEGIGPTTFTTIPGGPPGTGPAWATANGLLALVQQIRITDGGAVIFQKTYGKKTGRGASFTCTATLPNGFLLKAELVAIT